MRSATQTCADEVRQKHPHGTVFLLGRSSRLARECSSSSYVDLDVSRRLGNSGWCSCLARLGALGEDRTKLACFTAYVSVSQGSGFSWLTMLFSFVILMIYKLPLNVCCELCLCACVSYSCSCLTETASCLTAAGLPCPSTASLDPSTASFLTLKSSFFTSPELEACCTAV